MKKGMFVVLALVTFLSFNLAALAGEGPLRYSERITVQATVSPYAKITWGDEVAARFSGAASETKTGRHYFNLETNGKVGFTLDTTAFTQEVDGVTYEIDRRGIHWGVVRVAGGGNYGPGQGTGHHGWYTNRMLQDIGAQDYYLYFKATTGANISDQYWGTYTADVTLTITAL